MKRMSSLALVPLLGLILSLAACSGGGGGGTSSSDTSGSGSAGSEKAVISGHVTLPSTLVSAESVTVTITADSTTAVASTKSDDYFLTQTTGTAPTQQLEPALTVPVDANGNFSAVVPAGTSYSTAVKLPAALGQKGVSFAATSGQGSIIGGIAAGPGEKITLTLDETHLQQPGTVTLRVVDALTGSAVSGTTATLIRTGQSVPVNADGTLTFTEVLPGNHTLLLATAGYADVTKDFALTPAQALSLGDITLTSQTGSVVGQVSATGFDSLAGIVVYLRGLDGSIYSVLTNASGLYRFDRIPAAAGYSVLASANHLRSEKVDNIDVATGATSAVTTLHLQAGETDAGAITGFARFAERADLRHAGIIVSIEGTDMEAITARDGSYVLNNVPAGTYTLNYTDSNHQTVTTQGVKVVATAATKLDPVVLASVSGGLSGEVRAQGGAALPGAVLTISGWGESTVADAQGQFSFAALPVGTHTLEASLPGYSASQVVVVVKANTTIPLTTPIELVPHHFSGRVLGADTGLGGVSVTLSGAATYATTTASDGAFTLAAVPPGNYQLILTLAGYKTQNLAVYISENVADYALPYDVKMTLNYGTLSGVARLQNADDHSGTSVTVANTAYTTQTDFNGNWSMSLPEGSYAGVQYAHAGFITQNKNAAIAIVGEKSTALATVTLNREVGTIKGVVQDSSGTGLQGAVVIEPFSGASATTVAGGSFTLSNIPVGTRTVTASFAGHTAGSSAQVTVASGTESNITATPIKLTPYQFKGTLSLGTDVTDHSQVQLVLEGPVNKTTYSAADGSFTFTGAPAGNYRLTLSKSGFITKTVDLQVPDVAVYTLPYTLDLAKSYGTLSGAVRLQNADDHSGTTVTVGGTSYTTQTDISGNWSMSLPEGSYTGGVQYSHAGFISQSTSASITITNKTGTSLAIVTLNRELGSISGVVQDSSGAALVGATVIEPFSGLSATTVAGGSFMISNVPVGTRTVTASAAGHTAANSAQVTVNSGATSDITTPIKLTPYQFSGTVSLGTGVTDHSQVQLVLEGPVSKTTFSDLNGKFSFAGAPAGNYRLTLSKNGYVTKSVDLVLPDTATYTLPYILDMTVSYGTLSGVARLQNATDHSGTTITVGSTAYTTQTDFNGSWSMSLPVGSYAGGVQYAHAGFISQSNTAALTIASDTNSHLATVTLNQQVGTVSGLVKNSSGTALWNVAISEPVSGSSTTTAADGSFTLPGIPVGTRTVNASLAGYAAGSAVVNVTSGATSNAPITLTAYQFTGKVSLGTSTTDHSGVQLVLEGPVSKTTFSAVDGSFSFIGAPSGNYRLTMNKSGYVSKSVDLVLPDATYALPYTLDMTVSYGTLSGVARLQNATDHSGTIVTVSGSFTTQTDANGSWSMSLPVGSYTGVLYSHTGFFSNNDAMAAVTITSDTKTSLTTVTLNQEVGSIRGVVQNSSGATLVGAAVNEPLSGAIAITDVNGSFTISNIPVGTQTVTASLAGHTAGSMQVTVASGGESDMTAAPIKLTPYQFKGTVSLGTGITDHSGVQLVLEGPVSMTTFSAADGSFSFAGAPAGNYRLTLSNSGYVTKSVDLVLTDVATYMLPYSIQMTLSYGTLSGVARLQNATDHSGTAVNIIGTAYTAQTDANGSWSMSLPVGSYIGGVQYTHAGFNSQSDSTAISIASDTSTPLATVTLNQQVGSITGVVQDSSGAPLVGASVIEPFSGASTNTVDGGSFTLANIPVGTRAVTASLAGHTAGSSVQVTVDPGATSSIVTPITLTPYQFNGIAQLSGTTDHGGVQLVLEGPASKTTFSAADGKFTFTGAPAGNYRLTLSKSGYVSQAINLVLSDVASYTLPYQITLTKAEAQMSGVVQMSGRSDYSGVIITVTDASAVNHQTVTNTLGQWVISLPTGVTYSSVTYTAADYKQLTTDNAGLGYILSEGSNLDLGTVSLQPDIGTISGHVVSGVTGVTGAQVTMVSPTHTFTATTDSSGYYQRTDVVTGTYTVSAYMAGYGTAQQPGIIVTQGVTTADLTLTANQITGSVVLEGLGSVSGIPVILRDSAGVEKNVNTDTSGAFTLTQVAAGTYTLIVNEGTGANASYEVSSIPLTLVGDSGYAFTSPIQVQMKSIFADRDLLTFDYIKGANTVESDVHYNLVLPLTMPNGSAVAWTSDNLAIISAQGVVTLPYSTVLDNVVRLEATLTSGTATDVKTFDLTVPARYQPKYAADAQAITLAEDFGYVFKGMAAINENGEAISYAISGNTDPTLFESVSIDPQSGEVTLRSKENQNGSATITIKASSGTPALTATATLSVTVTAVPDLVGVNAGPDQLVIPGTPVVLNGDISDVDNNATLSWEIISRPASSDPIKAFISNPTQASATFTPDAAGKYMVRLTVHNTVYTQSDDLLVEAYPQLTLTVSGQKVPGDKVNEGDNAVFTLTLSHKHDYPVTLNYATADLTAQAFKDYQPVSGSLTFAADETLKTIVVPVTVDELPEAEEQFQLQLTNMQDLYNTSATMTATATIAYMPLDLFHLNGKNGTELTNLGQSVPEAKNVAVIGDINGDGYEDLAVSAPYENTRRGKVTIILGGTVVGSLGQYDLTAPGVITISGYSDYSRTGYVVAGAGDFNNDGYDDLVLGSPFNKGTVFVIYGSASPASIDLATTNLAATGKGLTITGASATAMIGWAAAGAGDVNGDHYADIVLGAENMSTSYVVYGGKGLGNIDLALPPVDGVTIMTGLSGSWAGAAVTGVGDVNGDGFDDVLVGAWKANSTTGRAYLVYGNNARAASLDLEAMAGAGVVIDGNTTYGYFGYAVACGGDFNGDGFNDLLIGAHKGGTAWRGEAFVLFGGSALAGKTTISTASMDQAAGIRLVGASDYGFAGQAVAGAGDVNGDGKDDILIGIPGFNGEAGRVVLVYGGLTNNTLLDSTIDGSTGFTVDGLLAGNKLGASLSGAGDVSGDGYYDYVAGEGNGGHAYLLFGGNHTNRVTADLSGFQSYTGTPSTDVVVGDTGSENIYGKGGADVVSSGKNYDFIYVTDTAFTRIDGGREIDSLHFDAAGQTLDLTKLAPESIRNIERIYFDGSGPNTILLDALTIRRLNHQAGVQIHLSGGSDDKLQFKDPQEWTFTQDKITTYTYLPTGMTFTADATLPTWPKITVESVSVHEDLGSVRVRLRRENGVYVSTVDYQLNDGTAVAGIDYVDDAGTVIFYEGELVKEVTVNVKQDAKFETLKQFSIEIFNPVKAVVDPLAASGTISIIDDTIDISSMQPFRGLTLRGGTDSKEIGYSLAVIGDVNGDGYEDMLIGARPWQVGSTNSSYIVFGGPHISGIEEINLTTLDVAADKGVEIRATEYGEQSVAALGDVNGDGYDDLAIGVKAANGNTGETYLVFGAAVMGTGGIIDFRTGVVPATQGVMFIGDAVYDYAGHSVAGIGDINGDGYDDIAIGAYGADPGLVPEAGTVYVIKGHGGPWSSLILGKLSASAGFTISGTTPSNFLGTALSGAGDVNGDGFADLLVGEPRAKTVHLILGASTLGSAGSVVLTDANVLAFSGSASNLGDAVSGIGDVNRDGYDDILIGAYRAGILGSSGLTKTGQAYVVYGRASMTDLTLDTGLDGVTGFIINGTVDDFGQGIGLGARVGRLGDINGDGYDDLLLSSILYNTPNGYESDGQGKVYVIYGSNYTSATYDISALDITTGFSILGETVGAYFGSALGGGGDVNGDGYYDLLMGAYEDSSTNYLGGKAYLIYGGDFLGKQYYVGTAGDDSLTHYVTGDYYYYPMQGNDWLSIYTGPDYSLLGQGDDTLVTYAYSSDATIGRLDGGKGFDTLDFSYGVTGINFATFGNSHIKGIERIDLSPGTGQLIHSLTLSNGDIRAMLDTNRHTFYIDGDVNDSVTVTNVVPDWTWSALGDTGDGYQTWQMGTGPIHLKINKAITAVSVP